MGITAELAASSFVCVGTSVSVPFSASGTGLSYQWYKNGLSLGVAQQSSTLSLTSAQEGDAGRYSVVVSGSCNSLTSSAFSLTINSLPTLSNASISAVCSGNGATVALSGLPVSGTILATYAIAGDAPSTDTVSANASGFTTRPLMTADHGKSLTISQLTNQLTSCSVAITHILTLTVNDIPTPVLTSAGSATVTCANLVTLVATGGSTYLFDGPALLSQDPGGTAIVNGTGTYSVTVASGAGCHASTTIAVAANLVPPSVSLVASNGGVLTCNLPTVTLTAWSNLSVTYLFGGPGIQTQNATTGIATANSTGTYSVTAQTSVGCTKVASISISGSSTPLSPPTVTGSGCATNLTIIASSPGATGYQAIGPGYSQCAMNGQFVVAHTGTYTITASNGFAGCEAVTIKEVTPTLVASATSFTSTGAVSCGVPVELRARGTGTGFLFTGPGGYVFSNVHRVVGIYQAWALNVTQPGTYTLRVSIGEGCPFRYIFWLFKKYSVLTLKRIIELLFCLLSGQLPYSWNSRMN